MGWLRTNTKEEIEELDKFKEKVLEIKDTEVANEKVTIAKELYQNIRVTKSLAHSLKKIGFKDETYEEIIRRLIRREELERIDEMKIDKELE